MADDSTEHAPFDETIVPVRHPPEDIDDTSPVLMASRMGTGTRLMMFVFGMTPVVGILVAFGALWEGGYSFFLEMDSVAWLGYPVMLPFFGFAALWLYATLVLNNRRISKGSKVSWLVGLIAAAPIAIPAYWWIHVWHAPHLTEPPPAPRPRHAER